MDQLRTRFANTLVLVMGAAALVLRVMLPPLVTYGPDGQRIPLSQYDPEALPRAVSPDVPLLALHVVAIILVTLVAWWLTRPRRATQQRLAEAPSRSVASSSAGATFGRVRVYWMAIVFGIAAGLLSMAVFAALGATLPSLTWYADGPGVVVAYPLVAALVSAIVAAYVAKSHKLLNGLLAPVLVYVLFWTLANAPW